MSPGTAGGAGNIAGCHSSGGRAGREARAAAKHPAMCRAALGTRNDPGPDEDSPEDAKPWRGSQSFIL